MKKKGFKGFKGFIAIAVIIFLAPPAKASPIVFSGFEIYLTPVVQNVNLGSQLNVDIWMDFSTNPTLGGGLDLSYDPSILQFAGFVLNAALPDDPSFRNLPTNWTGGNDALYFENFGGFGGPHRIGTILFDTLNAGVSNIQMSANIGSWGGFTSIISQPQNPNFFSADINVVPEPATVLLFISGLGFMGFLSRRQTKQI